MRPVAGVARPVRADRESHRRAAHGSTHFYAVDRPVSRPVRTPLRLRTHDGPVHDVAHAAADAEPYRETHHPNKETDDLEAVARPDLEQTLAGPDNQALERASDDETLEIADLETHDGRANHAAADDRQADEPSHREADARRDRFAVDRGADLETYVVRRRPILSAGWVFGEAGPASW